MGSRKAREALRGAIGRAATTLPATLHIAVRRALWPPFECELCVGQEYWQGCYCAYHGATAPCDPYVAWWRRWGRRAWEWVFYVEV